MTMDDLTLKVAVLIGDNIPADWIAHAIHRTTRHTQNEKEQAMTYLNTFTRPTAGDIGEEQEEVEFVPLEQPSEAPVEPAVPAEPVPA